MLETLLGFFGSRLFTAFLVLLGIVLLFRFLGKLSDPDEDNYPE